MGTFRIRKYSLGKQYLISLILILFIAVPSFFIVDYIGYRVVALMLLLGLSILAILFDIFPVLLSAILSALIWNFFFIPPLFTFAISSAEDTLLFLMYFVVATINAVFSFKIRDFEKRTREKEDREKAIKLYNALLNSLSHELRTPIATIIGSIDTIKENEKTLSEVNKYELYNEIEIAGFRLNRQVENLLNMSRLESGMLKPKLDWCDLNDLVNTVIHKSVTGKGNKIVFQQHDKLPLFKLDSGLIKEVLQNIIQNAFQYNDIHTTVNIAVSYENNQCVISVADNGKGFPEEEIPRAFDKFYRLPNTRTGGSGLGLSIVKGFVEAHNGTVKLENMLTGGAKFSIEIPADTTFINNLKNE